MSQSEITIRETFTRDQLISKRNNPESNEVLSARVILNRLRQRGVPVIGVLGVLAVEWGTLTIAHADGLDGDEWTYTYTGKPMPREWIERCARPDHALRLDKPLAAQIAEDEEL